MLLSVGAVILHLPHAAAIERNAHGGDSTALRFPRCSPAASAATRKRAMPLHDAAMPMTAAATRKSPHSSQLICAAHGWKCGEFIAPTLPTDTHAVVTLPAHLWNARTQTQAGGRHTEIM